MNVSHRRIYILARDLKEVQTFPNTRSHITQHTHTHTYLCCMLRVMRCGSEVLELHFGGEATMKHEYGANRYSSSLFYRAE